MTIETSKKIMRGYHAALKGPTPQYLKDVGAQVRAMREKRGWTQKELGSRLRPKPCTQKYIDKVESGQNLTLQQLHRICTALDAELKIRIV